MPVRFTGDGEMRQLLQSRDVLAGLLLAAIGALYLAASLALPIGSAIRMGSGYFPMLVSGLLILVGIGAAIAGIGQAGEADGPPAWRALVLIIGAVIVFGASVRSLGLVPAVMATALMSCWATGQFRVHQALLTAALLALFCWGIFILGLGLALDPFVWPPFH
jgi:hypothetical protein